jgi:hypothetical protein
MNEKDTQGMLVFPVKASRIKYLCTVCVIVIYFLFKYVFSFLIGLVWVFISLQESRFRQGKGGKDFEHSKG